MANRQALAVHTRTGLTSRAREQFIEVLSVTANVSEAARAVGFSRTALYVLRNSDPEFAAAWDEAVQVATDALEREAWRRAVEGWEEPVFYQGSEVGAVRKYSDKMLELLLRAHRPERYRDETAINVNLLSLESYARNLAASLGLDEGKAVELARQIHRGELPPGSVVEGKARERGAG